MAVGDIDRDGLPDLLTAGKYFVRQWRTSGGCGPGITLTLDAGPGNAHGIGAEIVSAVGGRSSTTWMLPGSASGSDAPEVFIGLGGAEGAESLVVRWPGGGETALTDVPAGPLRLAK